MADFVKWIGGAIGWAVGGPIGALIGFSFGELVDSLTKNSRITSSDYKDQYKKYRHSTSSDDFEYSLLILSAAVMKADGVKLKSELHFINQFYIDNYGREKAKIYMEALQKLLNKDFNLKEVCEQIRYFMEHSLRLQVIHYLFSLANSDGKIHAEELRIMSQISSYLGIHQRDFASIQAMFSAYSSKTNYRYKSRRSSKSHNRTEIKSDPYVILEIKKSATDMEVKKAYRRLARKYHPDKVAHLGEKYIEDAKAKFIIIDKAYNTVKRIRGMK